MTPPPPSSWGDARKSLILFLIKVVDILRTPTYILLVLAKENAMRKTTKAARFPMVRSAERLGDLVFRSETGVLAVMDGYGKTRKLRDHELDKVRRTLGGNLFLLGRKR